MKFRLIILSVLLSCLSAMAQSDTIKVKVMTYNLRFGELASLEQLAQHIKSFNPDFVALQEVDCNTMRERAPHQNGKNFVTELAYHTGMFGFYCKNINYAGGYYGIGILSKYPMIYIEKMLLPNPEKKEQRGLIVGNFEMEQDTITFACTHLEVSSEKTRLQQVDFINNYFKNAKYPTILGGDFNTQPSQKPILEMRKVWGNVTNDDLTYPSWAPRTKIDYLFTLPQKGWKVIRTQAVHSVLSDHLPIVTEMEYIR